MQYISLYTDKLNEVPISNANMRRDDFGKHWYYRCQAIALMPFKHILAWRLWDLFELEKQWTLSAGIDDYFS
jgi:hypothetical protein